MPMLIDERYLPATLTAGPMTDDEFLGLCEQHEDLRFELTENGDLIVQPMPFNVTASQEEELYAQLRAWARADGRGYASGSNQWFALPGGAYRVPDAAWVIKNRVADLPREKREKYWHICPDFVAEIKSPSDRLSTLRAKMQEWIVSGAQLAWLIDPERRAVEIYRRGADASVLTAIDTLSADALIFGFILDLRPIWNPFPELEP